MVSAKERRMDTQLEMLDSLMVPLSIDHFSDGSQLPSDVYFRIHANKYIPVGKRGQASHFQDLHLFKDKIKDKRQQIVYLRKSELKDFVNMCLLSFQKIEAEAGDLDLKVKFLTQSSDLVSKQFEFLGVNSETIESAKVLTKSIHEVARQSHSVIELLYRFKGLPRNHGLHAVCVSTVSAMIAIELGWASDSILEKISIGGLLHDIGLQNFPESLLQKPYLDLTSQERALYETHPYVGAQVLRTVPGIPPEVISIVHEHHENSAGEGYPRRLDDGKINPLSKVVALATQFSELILPAGNEEPLKPEQAMNYIQNVLGQPFNPECYRAFKAIFGKPKPN